MRGLKPNSRATRTPVTKVAPYVGAWIETDNRHYERPNHQSHPTWVRGLKPDRKRGTFGTKPSHPTWVRGLKQSKEIKEKSKQTVAPYVGAWIETVASLALLIVSSSHPTWAH